MKLLNINSYYYSSTVHRQMQEALRAQNLEPVTYVPLSKGYMPRPECQYSEEDWVNVSRCYREVDRYLFHFKHGKILKDLFHRFDLEQFACLHAHSLFSNGYIAMKVKQKYGIPYIVAVRNTDVNSFFKYMVHLRRIGLQILRESDRIVFLSKPYRDNVLGKFDYPRQSEDIYQKSLIIPNGIDGFWFLNKGRAKSKPEKNNIKLLYAGAVSKSKNITTTIKAIDILKQKGCNIVFTVVGKIADQHLYNQIMKRSDIKYISPQPKEELLKIYRDNDIFVMPSIKESFGLVYAEAMSQGTPVIYSKGQGFDGHFEDGIVGYSVDCFDETEIADKITRILGNYERFSDACTRLGDKFSWVSISQQYGDIYTEILEND